MITPRSLDIRPSAAFLRLALLSVAVAAATLAGGYFPTVALAGHGGVTAMLVGVGIALGAALVGLIPPTLRRVHAPSDAVTNMMLGMLLRFLCTLGLLVAALLCGVFAKWPLGVWTAIGYLVLLLVDTTGMVWLTKQRARTPS